MGLQNGIPNQGRKTPHPLERAWRDFHPTLMKYAKRLCGDEAEDLMQDTALVAFRHYDPDKVFNVRGYLTLILKHRYFDMLRRTKKRKGINVQYKDKYEPFAEDEHQTLSVVVAETFVLLATLSEEHRDSLLMSAEGFTHEEIAEQLGVPVGTVKSRIFNARRLLCERRPD